MKSAIVYLIAKSMSFFTGVFGSDFEIQKHVSSVHQALMTFHENLIGL